MSTTPRRHVLVIDDHVDINALICAHLERAGHRTRGAVSAAEAVQAILEFQPDVVLLEWALRGDRVDGLARALRTLAEAYTDRLLIIVLSSVPPEDFPEHASIDAYFLKPTSLELIEQRIDQLIAEWDREN